MVYLLKKDVDRIIKILSKIPSKETNSIIKKLKSPLKKRVYVRDKFEIRKLVKTAFKEKRKIKIRYYSPHSDEHTTRLIEVYRIHTNAIIAFCNLRKDERVFRIDRINSAAILDEKYTIPKGWKPESIILDK